MKSLYWLSRTTRNIFSADRVQNVQARRRRLPDTYRLIYGELVPQRELNRESGAAEGDKCSRKAVERNSDVRELDS